MPTSRLSKTFESTWGNPHYINTDPIQPLCLLTSFPQFSTVKYCLATRLQHTAYVERVTHWGRWRRYLFQTTTTLAPQGISSPSCSRIHWLTMLETASRQLCPGSAFKVLPYFLWRSDSGSLVGLLKHFYDPMRHARFSRSLKKKGTGIEKQAERLSFANQSPSPVSLSALSAYCTSEASHVSFAVCKDIVWILIHFKSFIIISIWF